MNPPKETVFLRQWWRQPRVVRPPVPNFRLALLRGKASSLVWPPACLLFWVVRVLSDWPRCPISTGRTPVPQWRPGWQATPACAALLLMTLPRQEDTVPGLGNRRSDLRRTGRKSKRPAQVRCERSRLMVPNKKVQGPAPAARAPVPEAAAHPGWEAARSRSRQRALPPGRCGAHQSAGQPSCRRARRIGVPSR